MSNVYLLRIRNAFQAGNVDFTLHANEELAEDDLDVEDLYSAVSKGQVIRHEDGDPRGTRYTLAGPAVDGRRRVGLVGRFTVMGVFLVITAFEALERE